MIIACSLQSGSNGNCFYVETPDTKLIVDAGISGRQARNRLAEHNREIYDADALLITHNHSDHVGNAGVFNRKFKLPMHISSGSWNACKAKLGTMREVNEFAPGESFQINDTHIETILTPHDGIDGVAFVISHNEIKLGIFTDLGYQFTGLDDHLSDLNGLIIESNYDPTMLENGPYPPFLKQRITGNGGHLSNAQASELVHQSCSKLNTLILAHLSEHNNHPDIALTTARELLGNDINITVAPRTRSSEMFEIC